MLPEWVYIMLTTHPQYLEDKVRPNLFTLCSLLLMVSHFLWDTRYNICFHIDAEFAEQKRVKYEQSERSWKVCMEVL